MKALFLGAGASYDFGLPLVWELTAEIKRWLTEKKIDWLNEQWKSQGGGRSNKTLELTKKWMAQQSFHYEAIVGAIEVAINRERDSVEHQELHGHYLWLLQMIYHMLMQRQVKNSQYISGVVSDLYGIKKLADENKPLWVFSLNHDVNLEILAGTYQIPIKSGFNQIVTLPERSETGEIIGHLRFEKISRPDMDQSKYDFFSHGEYGINLIKLHGALDIFASGDEKNYLKILPDELSASGYTQALTRANINLRYNPFAACTNEIAYADDHGKMQFLRRTLLSGAHKFTGKTGHLAPPEFLKLFKSYLNHASELVCIGYGFRDAHIDSSIRDWLSFSADRKLVSVNPAFSAIQDVSNTYLHLAEQIEFQRIGFIDYLMCLDSSRDSIGRKLVRGLRSKQRKWLKDSLEKRT